MMAGKAIPQNEGELLDRAWNLAGRTLAELAKAQDISLPPSQTHAKGWIGQLLEKQLGASAENKPEPDFLNLGIELKTLPINFKGEPRESTYVCTAPLSSLALQETWETSRLRKKLAKVLWIPIEADPSIPFAQRKIGAPILFKLMPPFETILKEDWEELMEQLHLGQAAALSSHSGQFLQIRPKAAHSRIKRLSVDQEGDPQWLVPKGFYLRTQFTQTILSTFCCSLSRRCAIPALKQA